MSTFVAQSLKQSGGGKHSSTSEHGSSSDSRGSSLAGAGRGRGVATLAGGIGTGSDSDGGGRGSGQGSRGDSLDLVVDAGGVSPGLDVAGGRVGLDDRRGGRSRGASLLGSANDRGEARDFVSSGEFGKNAATDLGILDNVLLLDTLGVGEELLKGVASGRGVDGTDHASAAVVSLATVEPDGLGVVNFEVEVDTKLLAGNGNKSRAEAALEGLARLGKARLGDGVIHGVEVEDSNVTNGGVEVVREVRLALEADLDNVSSAGVRDRDGGSTGGGQDGGSKSLCHLHFEESCEGESWNIVGERER